VTSIRCSASGLRDSAVAQSTIAIPTAAIAAWNQKIHRQLSSPVSAPPISGAMPWKRTVAAPQIPIGSPRFSGG
jgi:hypothetical protein